jgi:hypothetical protein
VRQEALFFKESMMTGRKRILATILVTILLCALLGGIVLGVIGIVRAINAPNFGEIDLGPGDFVRHKLDGNIGMVVKYCSAKMGTKAGWWVRFSGNGFAGEEAYSKVFCEEFEIEIPSEEEIRAWRVLH